MANERLIEPFKERCWGFIKYFWTEADARAYAAATGKTFVWVSVVD